MALRTKHKLFPIGRSVWCVTSNENNSYYITQGVVYDTGKGRIYVKTRDHKYLNFSPQDRYVNLSQSECEEICRILNEE